MHEHEFQGQKLRHDHPGGELPHGYYGHPEDGSRATLPTLQSSGTVLTGHFVNAVSTADDYARYAAEAMNAATADDTEFIADGATVTAYVHQLAHVSATFAPDEGRLYPGTEHAFAGPETDSDEPLWAVTRSMVAEMAGRELSDPEIERITRAIDFSTARDAVEDAVFAVSGGAPDDEEDEDGTS